MHHHKWKYNRSTVLEKAKIMSLFKMPVKMFVALSTGTELSIYYAIWDLHFTLIYFPSFSFLYKCVLINNTIFAFV